MQLPLWNAATSCCRGEKHHPAERRPAYRPPFGTSRPVRKPLTTAGLSNGKTDPLPRRTRNSRPPFPGRCPSVTGAGVGATKHGLTLRGKGGDCRQRVLLLLAVQYGKR